MRCFMGVGVAVSVWPVAGERAGVGVRRAWGIDRALIAAQPQGNRQLRQHSTVNLSCDRCVNRAGGFGLYVVHFLFFVASQ